MSGIHQFTDIQGERRRLLVALDGRVKLLLMLLALGLNLAAGGVRFPLALLVISLLAVTASGVRVRSFLLRMMVPFTLAVIAFVTQLFWYPEGALVQTLPLFGYDVLIYQGALARGLELGCRILGGMSVLLFFSLTTPLLELMRAAHFFRCPSVLVELALIMYRYIFLMFEEASRIRSAQKSRLGYAGFRNTLRSVSTLGGMLILRSYDRAERSFAAMRCRGYRGVMTAVALTRIKSLDWGVLLSAIGILTTLWVMR
ncbi:MAG: cobalt ECF transporter T component CbiQ [Desulfuromonas sp.]|nr:MAG: cobalt ECF transporter T component CbiQ [Desulfuromonas sp.]